MSNPIFPTLSTGQDSSLYGIELEDPSMKSKTDGGYVVSRAKHTRAPRKSFKTGFTMIKTEDKLLLETFYNQMRGGSVIFDWTDPSDLATYQVRFDGTMAFTYAGAGPTQRWTVSISLEQA